jgi:hypothetical protein
LNARHLLFAPVIFLIPSLALRRRRGFLLQAMDGLADGFFQPLSTPIQMRNNSSAHARIPEFPQMIGDGGDRIAFTLR